MTKKLIDPTTTLKFRPKTKAKANERWFPRLAKKKEVAHCVNCGEASVTIGKMRVRKKKSGARKRT